MLRWFVRKVVKLVIEAIIDSDRLDELLDKFAIKLAPQVMSTAGKVKNLVESVADGDDIDSSKAIADALLRGAGKVEMAEIGDSSVTEGGDRSNVMDLLSNIGD